MAAGGRGSIQGGGQLGQSDSGHALQPGTLLDTPGGHPASGVRRIGNSVSLDFAGGDPKRLMSKETSGQNEIVD